MDENVRGTEIVHEIIPKFNFLYELGMPTGKKIKSTLFLLFIFIVGYIVLLLNKDIMITNEGIYNSVDIVSILNIVLMVGIVFTIIKLIVHIVFQTMQYKNIKYTFYNDHMTYEDSFLNQHKKNIEYANVKEVEIRRSIWDRILGYGIIVIYTNAENEYSNGLVIFSIKNPKQHYDIIDNLVHSPSNKVDNQVSGNFEPISNNIEDNKENEKVDNVEETHEEFLESLKNIEK